MDTPEEVIQHMLDALETPIHSLTKWEGDFIDSIREQFAIRKSLSIKQAEILERIYVEKTA